MAYILNDPAIFDSRQLNPFDVYYLNVAENVFVKDFLAIRWATSKGLTTKYFTYAAAQKGKLDALKYLHEKGVTWDESTCVGAASNGHPPASCRLIALIASDLRPV